MSEPWVRFEDEHLLVTTKPAGVRTRRTERDGQVGVSEWMQMQRPSTSLAVLHHVADDVSGLVVLGKTTEAERSFRQQRDRGEIRATYDIVVGRDARRGRRLRNDEPLPRPGGDTNDRVAATTEYELVRDGVDHQRYVGRPDRGGGRQVRMHARGLGMAIMGDASNGGADAPRTFLHETSIRFAHPSGGVMELSEPAPSSFDALVDHGPSDRLAAVVADECRRPLFDPGDTDAYVWIDRHHDGFPEVRVERLGSVALVLDFRDPAGPLPESWLSAWLDVDRVEAVYRQQRPRAGAAHPARLVVGDEPAQFLVHELGCTYRIDLEASPTSSGLFLDQRETRRRLLSTDLRGTTLLNAFAHTGSLSVAAAVAGAETLTQDLSTAYLDWARDNLRANGIEPGDHDFVYGDALDWMGRFAKRGRRFDTVLVDPPSSSTTRKGKRWSVARDLHALVELGAAVTAPGGTLFVSTNMAKLSWTKFLAQIDRGLADADRQARVETQTVPLDHRSSRRDPPYLKAAWLALDGATEERG